eukprot:TRINITY_DN879_c0_g1_i1.p1 TRINITY_DN879_c0_g1~~TRINITY_DN879_c0_g1_i1.p1  ORF type:complete len:621 (-),score=148.28 TRINITY_DN879_c0_g1_i1:188-2050(-)
MSSKADKEVEMGVRSLSKEEEEARRRKKKRSRKRRAERKLKEEEERQLKAKEAAKEGEIATVGSLETNDAPSEDEKVYSKTRDSPEASSSSSSSSSASEVELEDVEVLKEKKRKNSKLQAQAPTITVNDAEGNTHSPEKEKESSKKNSTTLSPNQSPDKKSHGNRHRRTLSEDSDTHPRSVTSSSTARRLEAIERDSVRPNIVYVFGEVVDLDQVSEEEKERRRLAAMTTRDRIYATFDDPTYSTISMAYTVVNFSAIFISTINFLIGSLPEFYCEDCEPLVLFIMEAVIIAFFTIDYIVRVSLTRKNRAKWMFLNFLNFIDLAAIVPFYIELILKYSNAGSGASFLVVLRVLRLFRVFRIFKVAKYSQQIPIAINAVISSGSGFGMAGFSIILFITLFGAAMFFGEGSDCYFDTVDRVWRYSDGDGMSPYQSIPHTLWWTLVTMTTVGYGDQSPSTALGRIIGSVTMLAGVLVLAFPLTILSNNFGEEYTKAEHETEEAKRTRLYRSLARGNDDFAPHESLTLSREIWDYMLQLKNNLNMASGAYHGFQRNFEQIELRLGKLRIIQGLAKISREESESKARANAPERARAAAAAAAAADADESGSGSASVSVSASANSS